ncbi:very short patch repair endonuclease [Paraburkholderia sediminicola]|uniref:very short patch repair endonuclease n=1 Tax=Paraburkholderia sediminicola TaxID=458836 RepID=UPI0038B96526
MKRVGRRNTGPEMVVRRTAFALGYRFRLHYTTLPGSPDIVFPSRRAAIFVHGCFWHGHDCKRGRAPSSNSGYWLPKLERNQARDQRVANDLRVLGWRVLTIWQCQIRDVERLKAELVSFLG